MNANCFLTGNMESMERVMEMKNNEDEKYKMRMYTLPKRSSNQQEADRLIKEKMKMGNNRALWDIFHSFASKSKI